MILSGIVASQLLGSLVPLPSGLDWVPAGAIGHFDFINGLYFEDGAIVQIESIIDDVNRIVEDSNDVLGISVDTTPVFMSGATADFIRGGSFTARVKMVPFIGSPIQLFGISATDAASGSINDQITTSLYVSGSSVWGTAYDSHYLFDANPIGDRSLFYGDPEGTSEVLNILAMSRSDDEIHLSHNGVAVISNTNELVGVIVNYVRIAERGGGTPGVIGYLTELTVWPLMPSSALPVLSAL
jgi:hypothetical protein